MLRKLIITSLILPVMAFLLAIPDNAAVAADTHAQRSVDTQTPNRVISLLTQIGKCSGSLGNWAEWNVMNKLSKTHLTISRIHSAPATRGFSLARQAKMECAAIIQ